MNIGFYSAKSGLISMQQGLDVVSNNISNVQTNGYKEIRATFSDLLYTSQKSQNPEAQTGHGVKLTKTDLMYEHGQLLLTNRELDFATPTDGFFAVRNAAGDINYTKDGAFYVSQMGEDWNLVTANGDNVLGYDLQPIVIPLTEDQLLNYESLNDRLGVFAFKNPYGLDAVGNNTYSETLSSGIAIADYDAVKLSGALELSSVDLAEQMMKMIELQRAFQLNSKMVQTSDEIENIVNNLR